MKARNSSKSRSAITAAQTICADGTEEAELLRTVNWKPRPMHGIAGYEYCGNIREYLMHCYATAMKSGVFVQPSAAGRSAGMSMQASNSLSRRQLHLANQQIMQAAGYPDWPRYGIEQCQWFEATRPIPSAFLDAIGVKKWGVEVAMHYDRLAFDQAKKAPGRPAYFAKRVAFPVVFKFPPRVRSEAGYIKYVQRSTFHAKRITWPGRLRFIYVMQGQPPVDIWCEPGYHWSKDTFEFTQYHWPYPSLSCAIEEKRISQPEC